MAKQFYKVINMEEGHHGVFYKIGINKDPNPIPLKQIEGCAKGAIYFTDAKNLAEFSGFGNHIAFLTPIGEYVIDVNGDKWKAHKIKITKILPFKQVVPLIKEIPLEDYHLFDIKLTAKMILNSDSTIEEKFNFLRDEDFRTSAEKLILDNLHNNVARIIFENYSSDFSFTPKNIEKVIKYPDLIDIDFIDNLFHEGNKAVLSIIAEKLPKKFVQSMEILHY